MPSAHPREVFGTLRFRLTIWNTAVVLVFVLVTRWGAREGLRWEQSDGSLVNQPLTSFDHFLTP